MILSSNNQRFMADQNKLKKKKVYYISNIVFIIVAVIFIKYLSKLSIMDY